MNNSNPEILILDDVSAELYCGILNASGVHAICFDHADNALSWLSANKVKLIIADLALYPTDGLTFIESVREMEKDAKHGPTVIWILSGYIDDVVMRLGRREPNNVERFLEKGINSQSLIDNIILRLKTL